MNNILNKSFLPGTLIIILIASISGISGHGKSLTVSASSEKGFSCTVQSELAKLDRVNINDSTDVLYNSFQLIVPPGATALLNSVSGRNLTAVDLGSLDGLILSVSGRPLAELSRPFLVRGRTMVTANVYPHTSTGIFREVDLDIRFIGSGTSVASPNPDPGFDKVFSAGVANFDQSRNWSSQRMKAADAGVRAAGPFDQSNEWYRVRINGNGLCAITGTDLKNAGAMTGNINSGDLRLFAGSRLPLPLDNLIPRPQFSEVAIIVEDGGDGIFDQQDRILLFGQAADRWSRENGSWKYINNIYDDATVYWLSVGGSFAGAAVRMITASVSTQGSVDTVIATYRRRVHVEADNVLRKFNNGHIDEYFRWFWTSTEDHSFFVSTPAMVFGSSADFSLYGKTGDTTGPFDQQGFIQLFVNNDRAQSSICNGDSCLYTSNSLVDGLSEIKLELMGLSNAPPYFDYLDLTYSSRLRPDSDTLDILLDGFDGVARIEIEDIFSAEPVILDLTDERNPVILSGYDRSSGVLAFNFTSTSSSWHRYYLGSRANLLRPVSVTASSPLNLYSASSQTDLVIITSQALVASLQEYVDYRRNQGHSIQVTTVEDIMDNFSYGMYDPTAIRDYLKFAYENFPAPAPSLVLFVGDGSYDFLDALGTAVPNQVPPYIHQNDLTSSDDNYVYFGRFGILDGDSSYNVGDPTLNRGYDMVTARWPVRSAAEVAIIVQKIKSYESSTSFGAWRRTITLVADDEFGTFTTELFHTTQTEELEKGSVPRLFDRNKIYLWEFPFVNRFKPAVNSKIVESINEGTLIVNFVGHGNPDVWTHEHVFTRNGDIPRLSNGNKLPFIYSASCAIGFFDDPAREGMAEDFLVYPDGGAIALISATRLVYSAPNAQFNKKTFDIMFSDPSLTMAEAMYAAKLQRQYAGGNSTPLKNDRAFIFLGDPLVKLGRPQMNIVFDSTLDTLTALEPVTISGRIVDQLGTTIVSDGTISVLVRDSDRKKEYRLINSNGNVQFVVPYNTAGPSIFRGTATVTAGQFNVNFIPPLDIGYGGIGATIGVYAELSNIDAAGLIDSLTISESITASADSAGPTVSIEIGGAQFQSGGFIRNGDNMVLTIADPSGINLAGALGHGISLEIDQASEQTVALTGLFGYDPDSYTSGQITYRLDNLEPGEHDMKIKVWDNANNSTTTRFSAVVQVESQLAITELLNYPNPMRDSTRFFLYLSSGVDEVSIEIFTVSGRKIKTLQAQAGSMAAEYSVAWNGADDVGRRVSTGVYLYKATAVQSSDGTAVESFGKIVVIN